jgi:hypothetical protein
MSETLETIASRRWLSMALALAALACIWPLWAADMLPIVDLPQHLATVRILRDLHTPGWHLDAYYRLDLARTQYLGWYGLAVLLSQVVSIENAAKILLSLYIFAVPFALLSYLRAHRRDPAWAILAAPLALNDSLWMGFCNYISAIPLLLYWLAQLQRQLDAPSRRRWLGLALLPVLIYFLHAQALLHGALLAVATVALHRNGLRTRAGLRSLAHLLPALGLFALWALGGAVLANQAGWATTRAGHNEPTSQLLYWPWPLRFSRLFDSLSGLYDDHADQHILLGLAALALVGLLLAWQERRGNPQTLPPRIAFPELAFALTLLLYFAAPTRYKWIYAINSRTVPIAALLFVAVLARARVPRRSLLLVPGVVLAFALGALHAHRFALFSLEGQPARQLLAQVPMGQRGVGILFNPTSVIANNAPFLHFAQYGVLDRGGMADFSFANYPQSPVTFVPPGPPNLPARFEKHPERFTMRDHGFWYDWFLVRDYGPDVAMPLFADAPLQVELVQRIGAWQLFRRRAAP